MSKKPKTAFVPKDAINRIHIGHAFAEYDLVRENPGLLVQTPAVLQATSNTPQRCFFVGRRGTGKTAITYLISNQRKNTLTLKPQVIAPDSVGIPLDKFRDTNQPPFKSLVLSFRKAILVHVLQQWKKDGLLSKQKLPRELSKEFMPDDQYDFDLGLLDQFEKILNTLSADKSHWLKEVKRLERFFRAMEEWRGDSRFDYLVLVDSIDEAWDGSDRAVIFLAALMHACVDLFATCSYANAFLFLRENVFDRVRQIDNEYSRLETFLVSLDWHDKYLLEVIERRLNFKLAQKLKQDGSTWRHFFEDIDGGSSWNHVVDFCRHRPRDLLAYVGFCIDIAQAK
ncbi:P-loop ATPase, Sll1717 family, partial [Rhodopirellula baltica]|uniref:P-loop ATPase, Sll1717 family n=1 Tax=Rhodopirellula baltica TaxID=265606 RepID=UPI00056B912E